MTTPPPYYTEASLLRAMETAGKFVEDEELRAALKMSPDIADALALTCLDRYEKDDPAMQSRQKIDKDRIRRYARLMG